MTPTEARHHLALIDAELGVIEANAHLRAVRMSYLGYLEHRRATLIHEIGMEAA